MGTEDLQALATEHLHAFCLDQFDEAIASADGPAFPAPFGPVPLPSATIPALQEDHSFLKQFLQDYVNQTPTDNAELVQPFCVHEPLCLEELDEANIFADAAAFGLSPGCSPVRRTAVPMIAASPTLPNFAPWKDGQLSEMVQRTFIHAPVPVGSPLPGALPRSSSTGDLSVSTCARSNSSRTHSRTSSQ